MKLDTVHHIAIIGSNYENTREFYVEKLGFEQLDEHIRPEKKDILFNVPNCQIKLDILRNSEKPDMVFDNLKIS